MKTAYNFGRYSPEHCQMPLTVSRLSQKMAGDKQEALCQH